MWAARDSPLMATLPSSRPDQQPRPPIAATHAVCAAVQALSAARSLAAAAFGPAAGGHGHSRAERALCAAQASARMALAALSPSQEPSHVAGARRPRARGRRRELQQAVQCNSRSGHVARDMELQAPMKSTVMGQGSCRGRRREGRPGFWAVSREHLVNVGEDNGGKEKCLLTVLGQAMDYKSDDESASEVYVEMAPPGATKELKIEQSSAKSACGLAGPILEDELETCEFSSFLIEEELWAVVCCSRAHMVLLWQVKAAQQAVDDAASKEAAEEASAQQSVEEALDRGASEERALPRLAAQDAGCDEEHSRDDDSNDLEDEEIRDAVGAVIAARLPGLTLDQIDDVIDQLALCENGVEASLLMTKLQLQGQG